MRRATPVSTARTIARPSGKAWLAVAGFGVAVLMLGVQPLVRGPDLMTTFTAPAEAPGEAFIAECMEAQLLFRYDTVGFRLAATPQERTVLRASCSVAFASGAITHEMRQVRDGARIVRDSAEGLHTGAVF